jgi:hypothetical protein
MKTPLNRQNGIVAILDALGAASYTDDEICKFLQSRAKVLELLGLKIEDMPDRISREEIEVFTFNDTVIIAYKTGSNEPNLIQISTFFMILRKFLVDSLSQGILFRGSVSIGTFYVDDKSNTVMGQAVTDAAAWYDKADWIGIQATPLASIVIQRRLESDVVMKSHLMLDYDVPLKNGEKVRVKAVNWVKIFFLKSLTPCIGDESKRGKVLELLSRHSVPLGTEKKYFNTIAFFDHAVLEIKDRKKQGQ